MIRVAVLVSLIFFQSVVAGPVLAQDNATPDSDDRSTGTITGTVASP